MGKVDEIKTGCFENTGHSDNHCLVFSQTYDPEYRGRYHAEVILERATQHGLSSYYGFAFKLSPDWDYGDYDKENNRVSIMQFISNFKDIDCGEHDKGAVPSTMIWIDKDMLYTKLRSGDPCYDASNTKEFKIGKAIPGQIYILIH